MFCSYRRHFVRPPLKETESERKPGVGGLSKPLLIKEKLCCLRCKAEHLLAFVKFVFAWILCTAWTERKKIRTMIIACCAIQFYLPEHYDCQGIRSIYVFECVCECVIHIVDRGHQRDCSFYWAIKYDDLKSMVRFRCLQYFREHRMIAIKEKKRKQQKHSTFISKLGCIVYCTVYTFQTIRTRTATNNANEMSLAIKALTSLILPIIIVSKNHLDNMTWFTATFRRYVKSIRIQSDFRSKASDCLRAPIRFCLLGCIQCCHCVNILNTWCLSFDDANITLRMVHLTLMVCCRPELLRTTLPITRLIINYRLKFVILLIWNCDYRLVNGRKRTKGHRTIIDSINVQLWMLPEPDFRS